MAASSLSQFIVRRKVKILAKYRSCDGNLFSGVVRNEAHLDERNILGHFNSKKRPTRRDVNKVLRDYLASSKPEGDKLAVFVGVSDSGPVCEVFGLTMVSGEDVPSVDKHFNENILNLVVKKPSPAHAILMDEIGILTFMLYSDSIRNVRTVLFQNNQTVKQKIKQFERELALLNDRSKSTTVLVGLEKSMKFIKEEASEALKGYTKVVSKSIIEANRMELDDALITSCQHWSEFDIVLEMKILRELFSEPEEKISSGVDDSLMIIATN